MDIDIQFHCDIDFNFRSAEECIRAFTYHDYSISLHTHSFYEINVILSGIGTHQIRDTAVTVHTGDVFIIPPLVPHAYFDTSSLDVFHILIRPEVIQNNLSEAANVDGFVRFTEIEPFLRSSSQTNQFLQLSQKDLLQLQADLDLLRDDCAYNMPQNAPLRLHTLWKLLYLFSIRLSKQDTNKNQTRMKYETQIIDTLEYIHKNYHLPINTDDLYKRVFLSRSTFLRSFSAICGCTPTQYISNYRCKKAMELLDDPKLTKTQVAHACGFYDLSHLHRAIKKHP